MTSRSPIVDFGGTDRRPSDLKWDLPVLIHSGEILYYIAFVKHQ